MSLKQFCWTEVQSVNSTMLVMHKNEVVHKTFTVQVLIKPQSPQRPPLNLWVELFLLFTQGNSNNAINVKLYLINQSTLCFGAIWKDNQTVGNKYRAFVCYYCSCCPKVLFLFPLLLGSQHLSHGYVWKRQNRLQEN